jgi:phage tail sheath protein FI
MAEYLSPGVYVEEIDAGPKPIEGVSTSTTGAVGVTARGPTQGRQGPYSGKPELVTSFAEFTRKFGGYLPEPSAANMATATATLGDWWKFPLAVKAFFDNGGQRMYVKRVVSGNAVRAETTLGTGVVSELVQNAVAADTTLRLRHLIGIDNGTNLTLVINGVAAAAPVTVQSYAGSGTVTLAAPVGQDLVAGRDWIVVSARTAAPAAANPDPRLRVQAKSEGAWGGDETALPPETGILAGSGVSAQIRPMVGASLRFSPGVPVTTTAAAAVNIAAAGQTAIQVAALGTFAANDIVVIGGQQFTVAAVAPGPPATITVNGNGTATPVAANAVITRAGPLNTATTFNVSSPGSAYVGALLEFDDGQAKEIQVVTAINGNQVTVGALNGRYTEAHRIRIIEAEVLVRYRNRFAVEQTETFSNLRFIDDGTPNYVARAVNDRSVLATLAVGAAFVTPSSLATFPSVPAAVAPAPERLWVDLIGGRDNLNTLAPEDFIGVDGGSGNRTGIQSLEDIDEVSICLVPGIHSTGVHDALISHCETLKDRFAILDPPGGLDIEGVRTFREPIDTKYAALYYPWLEVRDPSLRREIEMAPSAHMAGIYARVDVDRGVHKAPANEVIRGITRIAADVTKREQDMLNPRNINVLRFFPGRGNRVWGARCVTSDAAWKYINVRRLFIMIEESIDEGTQWVVFEPNDEPTWARVRLSITNFLTTQWRNGALQGATANEAFFVKCDRTTMTQDDIDNGRLICVIGIAPVKPAEFVIFRIQQKTLDANTN